MVSPSGRNAVGETAPLVSVVMPVYNGEQYLAEAIDSILTQTLSDLELIVVDDCSTDGSAAMVRDYASRDERVRLILHERNRGSASARNSGIAVARGEFIAAMDCDDISLSQRLEKQARFLQSHPDIGVVGAHLQIASADKTALRVQECPQQHAPVALFWIVGSMTMAGAAIMARREVLLAAGGYEESRRVADDRELLSRLFAKTRLANVPEALYMYRRHEKQKSESLKQKQAYEALAIDRRWLAGLWGEAPDETLARFRRLNLPDKLSWAERRAAKRDMRRLIDALIAHDCVESDDEPLLIAEVNRRLEQASPRIWQQFCHWRRRRFERR
ncbi:MAG: glycosyltransferase family 2 protein [Chloroflexi bacterium]|nr:glycosyltransferase family 2 protein [Chloroflexota bacterium]